MKAYKVFNSDWTCRGFQFGIGKTYTHEGDISLCNAGFHACKQVANCFDYYSFDPNNKVAEVELLGKVIGEDDNKQVTDKIKIVRELTWDEMLQLANTGKGNSGLKNSGDRNTGDRNSGDVNSGYRNSGDRNSGDLNSGDLNSGYRNSGDLNSGDLNSGDLNSGYRNSGVFCTRKREDTVPMFNKDSGMTWDEWYDHPAYDASHRLTITEWVSWDRMTDEEKKKHPKAFVPEGYVKAYTYYEAWANLWGTMSDSEKELFKTLPNFDPEIFEEITGILV